MNRPNVSLLVCLFVFAILVVGCRACPPKTDGPPNRNDSLPAPGPTKLSSDSTVKRVMANVMAGESDPLPLLSDDEWHDLFARTQVGTDNNGEARLKLSGCMTVYLFQTSRMIYAPCSKSERAGGNSYCQAGGTAVYNSSCAGRIEQVIETPTASIVPKGTWITVTYLADEQRTIVTVLKGSAEVRPVLDIEERTMGEATTINEGQFYLTVPDQRANQSVDQASNLRQAKNVRDSAGQLNHDLRPWLDRIKKHAEEDQIPAKAYSFTADIDCDCEHFGVGPNSNWPKCFEGEVKIWIQLHDTGTIGRCDPAAQGPNARPKG